MQTPSKLLISQVMELYGDTAVIFEFCCFKKLLWDGQGFGGGANWYAFAP